MVAAKKNTKAETKEVAKDNVPVTRKRTRGATAAAKESTPEVTKDTKDVVEELDVATKKDDVKEEPVVEKRKRGRPSNKTTDEKKKEVKPVDPSAPKRGRGRPKKIVSA